MIALALKLSKSGVSPIKIISSYDYESMHDSFSYSVKQLTDEEQIALACAGVMPAGHWVPLEVWALVVPVDVCETGDVLEEVSVFWLILWKLAILGVHCAASSAQQRRLAARV